MGKTEVRLSTKDTQRNIWGHGIDSCWEPPFWIKQWRSELLNSSRAVTAQKMTPSQVAQKLQPLMVLDDRYLIA